MDSDRDIRNAGATHIESDRSRGCEDRAANGAGEIIVLLGRLSALLNQRLSQWGGSRVCLKPGAVGEASLASIVIGVASGPRYRHDGFVG
jgi:hypothetical protein